MIAANAFFWVFFLTLLGCIGGKETAFKMFSTDGNFEGSRLLLGPRFSTTLRPVEDSHMVLGLEWTKVVC